MTPEAQSHEMVRSHDVTLAVHVTGDADGIPVIFVHGYPDTHAVWAPVIASMGPGVRCIAYDVRGAGESSRPAGLPAYRLERLVQDLEAVADATSPGRPVHVVGHDWGSIQSWEAISTPRLASRFASFTSISGPCLDHLGHFVRSLREERTLASKRMLLTQLASSWYVFAFHVPGLPELLLRPGYERRLRQSLARTEDVVPPDSPTRIDDARDGVALYRANVFERLLHPRERIAQVPVQLLVARRDAFVRAWVFRDLDRWAPHLERHELDGTHWILASDPELVASHVRSFVERSEHRGVEAE